MSASFHEFLCKASRFNTDGSLDASFNGTGKLLLPPIVKPYNYCSAVAIQPDGKIIAAGYTITARPTDFALVRYLANGALDNAYGAGGKVIIDFSLCQFRFD